MQTHTLKENNVIPPKGSPDQSLSSGLGMKRGKML